MLMLHHIVALNHRLKGLQLFILLLHAVVSTVVSIPSPESSVIVFMLLSHAVVSLWKTDLKL
jgi:hypothetical protein